MYTVLVVNENESEILTIQKVLSDFCMVSPVSSAKACFDKLQNSAHPNLILVDLALSGTNGFEVLMSLKTAERTKKIPVIILSGDKENKTEIECYRMGAADFLRKPITPELLKRMVKRQMEAEEIKSAMMEHSRNLQNSANVYAKNALMLEYFIIGVINDLLTKKDFYSGAHSMGVTKYFEILLKDMIMSGMAPGVDPMDFELILLSSRLHDMGKIGVPDSVLQKQGKYTEEEFLAMKMHTVYSADSIKSYSHLMPDSKFLNYTYQLSRYHHERFDGMGYPDRLLGQNIPFLARVLAVCDTYEALTAERSYKKAMTHEEACNIIAKGAGVQFDPQVVLSFQRVNAEIAQAAAMLKQTVNASIGMSVSDK